MNLIKPNSVSVTVVYEKSKFITTINILFIPKQTNIMSFTLYSYVTSVTF